MCTVCKKGKKPNIGSLSIEFISNYNYFLLLLQMSEDTVEKAKSFILSKRKSKAEEGGSTDPTSLHDDTLKNFQSFLAKRGKSSTKIGEKNDVNSKKKENLFEGHNVKRLPINVIDAVPSTSKDMRAFAANAEKERRFLNEQIDDKSMSSSSTEENIELDDDDEDFEQSKENGENLDEEGQSLFPKREIVYESEKFRVTIGREQFKRQKKHSISDHLYLLKGNFLFIIFSVMLIDYFAVEAKNPKAEQPLLIDVYKILRHPLEKILKRMRDAYHDDKYEHQIYSTIIYSALKSKNSNLYNLHNVSQI